MSSIQQYQTHFNTDAGAEQKRIETQLSIPFPCRRAFQQICRANTLAPKTLVLTDMTYKFKCSKKSHFNYRKCNICQKYDAQELYLSTLHMNKARHSEKKVFSYRNSNF